MNCELKDEKFDVNNLTLGQRVAIKPALTFLQIGATFYLSELVKPILLPILMVSIVVVLLVVLKARKQSEDFSSQSSPEHVLVAVKAENNSFDRPAEFKRN